MLVESTNNFLRQKSYQILSYNDQINHDFFVSQIHSPGDWRSPEDFSLIDLPYALRLTDPGAVGLSALEVTKYLTPNCAALLHYYPLFSTPEKTLDGFYVPTIFLKDFTSKIMSSYLLLRQSPKGLQRHRLGLYIEHPLVQVNLCGSSLHL